MGASITGFAKVHTLSYGSCVTDRLRLTPRDWIEAAFRALAAGGLSAVRIERLARDLGATKGSFYWHYKDLQALLDSVVSCWVILATEQSISNVNAKDLIPAAALAALIEQISEVPDVAYGGVAIEPAIREWARFDDKVSDIVVQVDARRIDYVADLLTRCGLSQRDAAEQAQTFYAIVIGVEHLRLVSPTDMSKLLKTFVSQVLPPEERRAILTANPRPVP